MPVGRIGGELPNSLSSCKIYQRRHERRSEEIFTWSCHTPMNLWHNFFLPIYVRICCDLIKATSIKRWKETTYGIVWGAWIEVHFILMA